jgi:hypothetical protein
MSADPNRLDSSVERRGVERRAAQRFDVHQPLAIHFEGRTMSGFIQNLSGRGMFFFAETALPEGAVVELTFTMPSEITLGENMPVRCCGRVLRASTSAAGHPQAGHGNGMAVRLDSYQYLPADEPVAQFVRVSAAGAGAAASGSLSR